MRHKLIAVSVAIMVLVATASVLSAQPMRRWGGPGAGMGPGARMEAFLNLTQEQKTKLEALRKTHQEEMKGLRDKLQGLQKQLRDLRQDPKADPKKIESLIDDIFKLRATQMKAQIKHQGEVEKILTPEQKEKLAQAKQRIARVAPRFFGRPGMGMGHWGMRGRFMGFPGLMMRPRWQPRWWR
jgi:Spy/CpxP family protein refolding chaperone